jgi:hypothetical protein
MKKTSCQKREDQENEDTCIDEEGNGLLGIAEREKATRGKGNEVLQKKEQRGDRGFDG